MNEPHPSYLVTLVAGEFADRIDGRRPARRAAHVPRAEGPRGGRRAHVRAHAGDDRALRRAHRRAVPVEQVRAGRRQRLHLRRHGEHHRDDDVRAHPARRRAPRSTSRATTSSRTSSRTSGSATTSRAATGRDGWLNEGFATFMEHVWREKHLGRDEYDYGAQARPRRRTSARRTAATGAPSSARTTTRRSISSTATSTRRAGSSSTCCAPSSATRSSGRGVSDVPDARTRSGIVETRDLHARARGGERAEPRALLRAVGLHARAPGARRRRLVGRRASSRAR